MAQANCTLIVAGPSSGENIQSGIVSGYQMIPQICSDCGSPTLANSKLYPYFFRAYYMGGITGFINLANSFGWTQVALVYSLATLERTLAGQFVDAATAAGLKLLSIQGFQVPAAAYNNGTYMMEILYPLYQALDNSNARIFYMIVEPDLVDWFYYGAIEYGFRGPEYAWCSYQTLGYYGANNTQIDNSFGAGAHSYSRSFLIPSFDMGVNLTSPMTQWLNASYQAEIIARFGAAEAQDPGWYGVSLLPYEPARRTFDVIMAIVTTWDRVLNERGLDASYLVNLTHQGVFTPAEVTKTNFVGTATAPITFDSTGSQNFPGIILQIYGSNQQAPYYNWTKIGTFNSSGITWLMTPDWTTSNGLPPLDHPQYAPDLFMFWNADSGTDSVAIIFGVLYGIHVLAAFASFFMVIVNRNKSEISRTGLVYYMVVTFGTLLVAIEGLFDLSGSSVVCELDAWLLGLGITAVLSMVMVKIGRVFRMGRNKKLMERQYKNAHFLISFAVTWTIQIILLIVWAATQSSAMTTTYTDTTYSYQCVNTLGNPTGITIVLYIYIGLLVLGSLVIGFCRKQVPPEEDREATYVVMALLNMGLCMGLELWQVTNTNMPVRMRSLLRLIIQWIGLFATQNLPVTLDIFRFVYFPQTDEDMSTSSMMLSTPLHKKTLARKPTTSDAEDENNFINSEMQWRRASIFGQWSHVSVQLCKHTDPFFRMTDEDESAGTHFYLSQIKNVKLDTSEKDKFWATLNGTPYYFHTESSKISKAFVELLNSSGSSSSTVAL
ncbi:periplasmic binding protein-like I [Polychytrium aggregatum]|uniref:periplasmic binding protein-like I n=1 Tax=Polychytrium aggregatum TaxID=110093 RepID=UPI0022FF3AD2|nr:periplasmic binding protein-like I [Polychytrium aggregatum]KAI9205054.1 periplasmic binding protein-like I [Polychytrium aggregatum]